MDAAVTISIDLELAWGNWDNLTNAELALVEQCSRPIVARLLEIFERHEVAATFAIVAGLLDAEAVRPCAGAQSAWYAPDVVGAIAASPVGHDIGSHGGRHLYYDRISDAEASDDLAYARALHDVHDLAFTSFVYPRNRIGKRGLLAAHDVRVFRAPDTAWHQRLRDRSEPVGRLANLVDKVLPISPPPVFPTVDHDMVRLPSSMLLLGRQGIRNIVPAEVMRRKLERGIAGAIERCGTFHLWFHPSNFYHRPDTQFGLLDDFLGKVAERRLEGAIAVRTMGNFATG